MSVCLSGRESGSPVALPLCDQWLPQRRKSSVPLKNQQWRLTGPSLSRKPEDLCLGGLWKALYGPWTLTLGSTGSPGRTKWRLPSLGTMGLVAKKRRWMRVSVQTGADTPAARRRGARCGWPRPHSCPPAPQSLGKQRKQHKSWFLVTLKGPAFKETNGPRSALTTVSIRHATRRGTEGPSTSQTGNSTATSVTVLTHTPSSCAWGPTLTVSVPEAQAGRIPNFGYAVGSAASEPAGPGRRPGLRSRDRRHSLHTPSSKTVKGHVSNNLPSVPLSPGSL